MTDNNFQKKQTTACPPFREKRKLHLRQVSIITKLDNTPSDHYAATLAKWLGTRGITVLQEEITPELNLIIVLGGDGTLLHIAEQAAQYSIPVLGINFGTLGFLSDITESEAITALERVISGKVTIENRFMLQVQVNKSKPNYCLNDVVIGKDMTEPLLLLNTRADNEFITTYKADGLIFSTATGSTAYNLSAGGPLVYPGLATITVTPICPFMLSSRPVILPACKEIVTSIEESSSNAKAKIIVDGRPCWSLHKGDTLSISPASRSLQLVVTSTRSYFTVLRNKLHWGHWGGRK